MVLARRVFGILSADISNFARYDPRESQKIDFPQGSMGLSTIINILRKMDFLRFVLIITFSYEGVERQKWYWLAELLELFPGI